MAPKMLKSLFHRFFHPLAQKPRQQSTTSTRTRANVQLVKNVGFVPRLAPATAKLDLNHDVVVGSHVTETDPSRVVVALNAVLNHGHVKKVQLHADETVDADATVHTDGSESFDTLGAALDSPRHSQTAQHVADGACDVHGTNGANDLDSAYHLHDSHDSHRPVQEIHLSRALAIDATLDADEADDPDHLIDTFDDLFTSSIDWGEYMISSTSTHKSNATNESINHPIFDHLDAEQDGCISPVDTFIHDSSSTTSIDEGDSDEASEIITAATSIGSDDSDQQCRKDGLDCYDEPVVSSGPGTSHIDCDYDGVISPDFPPILDNISSWASTNDDLGNNAPESGQMSDGLAATINPVTATHDPAGPDNGYLHVHEDGAVADDTSNRMEPQQKTTILPPFTAPRWSDDEEGDMWEEAFDELTSAPEETHESTQGNNVLPLPSAQEADDTWVEVCHDQTQCPNESGQDTKDDRNDPNPTLNSTVTPPTYLNANNGPDDHVLAPQQQAVPKPETNPTPNSPRYNYKTPEGRHRLSYIRGYLSLPQSMQPHHLVLYLIQPPYRSARAARAAPLQAAQTNPAFLRACLELDWRGLQDELPWPTSSSAARNWNLVQGWLGSGGHLITTTDWDGERTLIQEEEWCVGLTWGELLERVWWERPRDGTLVRRCRGLLERIEGARGGRRGGWEGRGWSRLGMVVATQ
ncbi:hypothetical protein CONLIGDRAFT_693892 [Coniochaeta ligniaria NRRL 30616]|uniref:Uncharacterized protein n=1 Tax=Coniochaeta ligniaria NRRL 30616 TaxID=1408157 RepID=A0A1J7I707_9PEZI|nr:hypothetical protein CONLIGDRAFT_693892 [Coniochaeta ligniaria NRRL 30616]